METSLIEKTFPINQKWKNPTLSCITRTDAILVMIINENTQFYFINIFYKRQYLVQFALITIFFNKHVIMLSHSPAYAAGFI